MKEIKHVMYICVLNTITNKDTTLNSSQGVKTPAKILYGILKSIRFSDFCDLQVPEVK